MQAQQNDVTVIGLQRVTDDIRLLTVRYPAQAQPPAAGQFYMLRCWAQNESPLLSRPISVHSYCAQSGELSFLFQIKGEGTQKLAALQSGDTLRLVGPSGNGFPLQKLTGTVALVGGGIGTAPLLQLAQSLHAQGCTVDFYGGWRAEPYRLDAFEKVCRSVKVATDTGDAGVKGYVTDIVPYGQYSAVCVCGPEIVMQKAAAACAQAGVACYVSREAKMACGVGACLGCTCKTKHGAQSVCKNGPVFDASEVYGE